MLAEVLSYFASAKIECVGAGSSVVKKQQEKLCLYET